METLVVVNMLIIIAVLVWLMRLENKLKQFREYVEYQLENNFIGLVKGQLETQNMVGLNHKKLIEIKDDLEKPAEKSKLFKVKIIDIETGKTKNYEYQDCVFKIESDRISIMSSDKFRVLGSHSLINRQYDIIECN